MKCDLCSLSNGTADFFKCQYDFPVFNPAVYIHIDLGYFRMKILARQSLNTADQTDTIFFRQTVRQQDTIYQQTKFAV